MAIGWRCDGPVLASYRWALVKVLYPSFTLIDLPLVGNLVRFIERLILGQPISCYKDC